MKTSSFIILFLKLVHDKPEKQVTPNQAVRVLSYGANQLHQAPSALQPVCQSCWRLPWENPSRMNPAPAAPT